MNTLSITFSKIRIKDPTGLEVGWGKKLETKITQFFVMPITTGRQEVVMCFVVMREKQLLCVHVCACVYVCVCVRVRACVCVFVYVCVLDNFHEPSVNETLGNLIYHLSRGNEGKRVHFELSAECVCACV